MSFGDDLRLFGEKAERNIHAVFLGSVDAVHGSVVEGSAVTGAPGQPVDTGNLKGSWQETFPEPMVGQVATNVVYAEAVEHGQQEPYTTSAHGTSRTLEDGTVVSYTVLGGTQVTPGPMTFRSGVGGAHSVKLTRAGWQDIVRDVARQVVS